MPIVYIRKIPRIFIVIKHSTWEYSGLVTTWDGIADYYYCKALENSDQYGDQWISSYKRSENEKIIDELQAFSSTKKCDMFFSYLSGRWLMPDTIKKAKSYSRKAVNIAFDDTPSFWGDRMSDGRWSGNAQICQDYDLNISCQNPRDVLKYRLVGAKAIFLPPGGNEKIFLPPEDKSTMREGVVFIGQKYGKRTEIVEYLQARNIPLQVFGHGWPNGALDIGKVRERLGMSLIALGIGYIGNGSNVGLKARDFEIPLTGCCYLTTYNPVLEHCFSQGKEILFFRDQVELYEVLTKLLNNATLAIQIGKGGRKRALMEHTWRKRWTYLLSLI